MVELRGVVPCVLPAPYNPQVIQWVCVDWLYREVDPSAEERMPALKAIRGYRNIEVYGYLRDTKDERDRKTCLHVYGE